MPDKIEIELSTPITGHGGQVTKVVLREPRARDLKLGDPFTYATKEGVQIVAENTEVLWAYIHQLLIEPDALILERMTIVDGYRVKNAIAGFLRAGLQRAYELGPTFSSSTFGSLTPNHVAG